jgi:glutamate transport system substrate-binding protein
VTVRSRILPLLAAAAVAAGFTVVADKTLGPIWPFTSTTVKIGINGGLPGWSKDDGHGEQSGFDIELATFLGQEFNFTVDSVPLLVEDREKALLEHRVDLVISNYSMDGPSTTQPGLNRKDVLSFAGPYFVDRSGVMYQRGKIEEDVNFEESKMCVVRGTKAEKDWPEAGKVENTIAGCMSPFLKSEVKDVAYISTDESILRAYALTVGQRVISADWIKGGSIEEEVYGVGMRRDDEDACMAITKKIEEFVNSARWDAAYKELGEDFDENERSASELSKIEPMEHRPTASQTESCPPASASESEPSR